MPHDTPPPAPRDGTVPIRIVIEADAPLRAWNTESPAWPDAVLTLLGLDLNTMAALERDDMLRNVNVRASVVAPGEYPLNETLLINDLDDLDDLGQLAPHRDRAPEERLLDAVLNGDPDLGNDEADEYEATWRAAFDASAELTEAVAAQRRGYEEMTPQWLQEQLHRTQYVLNALLVNAEGGATAAAHREPDVRAELGQHLEHFGRCLYLAHEQRDATGGAHENALADALAALGNAVCALAVLHPPVP